MGGAVFGLTCSGLSSTAVLLLRQMQGVCEKHLGFLHKNSAQETCEWKKSFKGKSFISYNMGLL